MSTGARISLRIAQAVAERLVAALAPACQRIAVAGSIRRGMVTVGDIELVAIPLREGRVNILDGALNELIDQGKLQRTPPYASDRPAWGDKYKKMWLLINPQQGIIQVDLFLATPDNWGAILTIRTGPAEFSKELVTHIKYKTAYQQQEGRLMLKATGESVPTPTEEEYFRRAGLAYMPPERRTVAELRRMIAQGRDRTGV